MTGATLARAAALVAGGFVFAAALAAQQPPAPPASTNPPRPPVAQAVGGSTAEFLAQHPQVLQLTAVQVQRVAKVANWVDALNTPVHNRMQAITGGRRLLDLTPAERRRVGPQLRPLLEQIRANNASSLDSIEAILTPDQTAHLESIQAEFKARVEARRAAMRPRGQ